MNVSKMKAVNVTHLHEFRNGLPITQPPTGIFRRLWWEPSNNTPIEEEDTPHARIGDSYTPAK